MTNIYLYAMLITTNLVRTPCPCGYCDATRGIVVMEHVNKLGYDLKYEVTTNYLPVVDKLQVYMLKNGFCK